MDTYWQKLRFLRSKGLRSGLNKAARVTASLGMVFALFGPNPYSPLGQPVSTAQAKSLDWGDMRPPLSDEADSDDPNGFRHLPDFGNDLHAIVVAPNGDVFAAGRAGDVNVNNDGSAVAPIVAPDCSDDEVAGFPGTVGDIDVDADNACDVTIATTAPAVFRSTDGGRAWRAVALPQTAIGATIRSIAVSPDYPTDDFVLVTFSTDVPADVATNKNGICWSTDAGLAFTCLTGATGTDAEANDILYLAAAMSPDFNYNDGNGTVAVGGRWVAGGTTVKTVSTLQLKLANPLAADFIDVDETTDSTTNTDVTLHLAYTYSEEPTALARLYVDAGAKVYGQILDGSWATPGPATEMLDDNGTSIPATVGQVAFDDIYTSGGSFFAAAGDGAAGGEGGVFRYDGSTWTEKTAGDNACDSSVTSLSLSGNGSATRIVASLSASNIVCRSTNEGASWSDANADGGDDVCNTCQIDATGALTRLASNRKNFENVYYSTSANVGGVMKSTSTGSTWADTGLTNQAYTVRSVTEVTDKIAFATVSVPQANDLGLEANQIDALFYTDNYGTGATWMRVLRTNRTDLSLVDLAGDFAVAGTAYVRFSETAATTDKVLKSTNGGMTWDDASKTDPFENGPDSNENLTAASHRSSTTLYVGGDKGHVALTTDGAATWTILAMDFGEDVDEFDFSSDAKIFFVTGEHTDNTNKVWQTKDSGATFTQVGNAPWGNGDGSSTSATATSITTSITGYKPADNTGYIMVMTNGNTSTDEVYRLKMGESTWTDLDMDQSWNTMLLTAAAGVGDGVMMTLWDSTADELFVSFFPFTGDVDDYDPVVAGSEASNLLLALPLPPVTSGEMGTARSLPGYTYQLTNGGRVMEMTLPAAYTVGVKLVGPPTNTSVSTNVGDNGIPVILRWDRVEGADRYEVLIGLDPDLQNGTILGDSVPVASDPGDIEANQLAVDNTMFKVVQGNTYYWAVRVAAAEGNDPFEGPWSKISSFSVASGGSPTQPEPQLPLDNTTTPNMGPIQFSFNLPAGTVQYQIQITPLNNDGPAINLIIGDPAQVSTGSFTAQPPVMGQGNYVLLPGTTYTWRVRATTKAGAINEGDSSWGSWSSIRIFKTPRPSSVTIAPQAVGTGNVTTDTTPTLSWKDSNTSNFYYEVQLSGDPNFNVDARTATSFVYWNLIHGGLSNPLNSWTVPDANAMPKGKYYWRVRQRVQGTALGPDEPGVGWGPTQTFTLQ